MTSAVRARAIELKPGAHAPMKGEMTANIALRTLLALALSLVPLAVAAPAHATHSQQHPDPYEEPWEHEEEAEDSDSDAPEPLEPAPDFPVDDDLDEEWDDGWDEPDLEPDTEPEIPLVTTRTVAGKVAMLRTNGKAAIPRGAPKRVRAIIAAGNRIAGKPYKWGGGHAKIADRGYDCSGAVSFALIRSGTGLLRAPLVSGSFKKWGAAGEGRWVTVYANKGHVYLEVAGLRLDTSAAGQRDGEKGVRWRPVTGRRSGFTARHPARL